MRFSPSAGLLAFAASANAFADSSPFVLLSTTEFAQAPELAQLQTGAQVTSNIHKLLDSCPTERYHLVSQPNVHAADIRSPEGCKARSLCGAIADERIHGIYSVAEVMGQVDGNTIAEYIRDACAKEGKTIDIQETALGPLPSDRAGRESQFADNEAILDQTILDLQSSDSYTLIYLSSPVESTTYVADFTESVSEELKKLRARTQFVRRQGNNSTSTSLFDKYVFFNGGVIHGLVVLIVLFSILGVGLRALGSLEVSYGAFEKDMGPAAQKKQN